MKIKPFARIVVEGMDGAGKTTLVSQMMSFLGENRAHFVPGYNRITGPKPEIHQWWMEQLGFNPENKVVVHDRFFYPELVYGPILRNKVNAPPATLAYVLQYLRQHSLLIYCRPPTEVLAKGATVQQQMKGVHERFYDLLIQYDSVMVEEANHLSKSGRFIMYDWTKDDAMSKLFHQVMGYIYQ